MGEYLGMNFGSFKIKRILFVFALAFMTLPALAVENIISSVAEETK